MKKRSIEEHLLEQKVPYIFYDENGKQQLHMCYSDCDHLKLIHNQPERSKREDSQQCEMRCSEHCGNTVRDK